MSSSVSQRQEGKSHQLARSYGWEAVGLASGNGGLSLNCRISFPSPSATVTSSDAHVFTVTPLKLAESVLEPKLDAWMA